MKKLVGRGIYSFYPFSTSAVDGGETACKKLPVNINKNASQVKFIVFFVCSS
jgi:hypothetical protein